MDGGCSSLKYCFVLGIIRSKIPIGSELFFWSELISLNIKVINSGLQCSLPTLNGLYCFMVIIYKYLLKYLENLSKNSVKENANNVIIGTL